MEKAKLCLFFLLILFSLASAIAHGDLDERIALASEEIETYPDSSFLYLKRGELYYQHEEYEKAISDYKYCGVLELSSTRLSLGIAKAYLKLESHEEALAHLEEILHKDPKNVLALRWKGHTLMELNRFAEAARSYEKVIAYADKVFTENYLEVSGAWEKLGGDEGLNNAIGALQKGIEDLGSLVFFHQRLVSIYEQNKDYEHAIIHQNTIIKLSNRKEFSYVKRAELWLATGNMEAAKSDLRAAKNAIESLSSFRRKNAALTALLEKITNLEDTLH